MLFMHNVHLKKCPTTILSLFPGKTMYTKKYHNLKLPYIKSSRHHKS